MGEDTRKSKAQVLVRMSEDFRLSVEDAAANAGMSSASFMRWCASRQIGQADTQTEGVPTQRGARAQKKFTPRELEPFRHLSNLSVLGKDVSKIYKVLESGVSSGSVDRADVERARETLKGLIPVLHEVKKSLEDRGASR